MKVRSVSYLVKKVEITHTLTAFEKKIQNSEYFKLITNVNWFQYSDDCISRHTDVCFVVCTLLYG